MPKQDIFIDTKQFERLTIELKGFEKEAGIAAYHAINRTVNQVITQVGRIVTKSYAIKAKEVKESFYIKKGVKRASVDDLSASLTSYGHTLSFAHFPYTPKTPGTKRIVKVKIKQENGKVDVRSGFVTTTGAKGLDKTHYNVFKRLGTFSMATKGRYKGKRREDIAPIRTLSIPQMITNENVADQIKQFATEKMDERLEHELIRVMTSMSNNIKEG